MNESSNQQNPPTKLDQSEPAEKRCAKCGKIIQPGQQYTHQGSVYCCDKCCHIKNTPGVCEFC